MSTTRIVNERERIHSLTGPEIVRRIVSCIVAEELVESSPAYSVYINQSWAEPRLEDQYCRVRLTLELKACGFFGIVAVSYTDKILPGVVEIRQASVPDQRSRERTTDHWTIDETTDMTDEQRAELLNKSAESKSAIYKRKNL